MKKLLPFLFLISSFVYADTTTARLGLTLPTIGSPTWGQKINSNFQILDSTVNITSGGSSGGSSSLAVSSGGVVISSPTSMISVFSPILVTLGGSATAQLRLDPSSVTLQGQSVLTLSSATATYLQLSSAAATYLLSSKGGSNIFPSTPGTMMEIVSSATFDTWVTVRGSETVAGALNSQGGFISTANCSLATINNTSSANNSRIQMTASGTLINRNIADTNPALIVNQISTNSTGDITEFQYGSVSKATMTSSGDMVLTGSFTAKSPLTLRESAGTNRLTISADGTNSTIAIGLGNNLVLTGPGTTSAIYGTAGTTITRNTSDGSPTLTVNNANATSTGSITSFKYASVEKSSITATGSLMQLGLVVASTNTAPRMMRFSFNGNGSAVSASTSCAQMNYEGNISSVSVEGDFVSTGSISVDIKRASVDAFPFGLQSIIGAGNKPSLSSASYSTITPASWTSTRLNLGDHICGTNDSSTTLTWATVNVWITP